MKKYFGKMLVAVLLVVAMAAAAQAADLAQTHETKNGISVKYPANWQVMENAQGPTTMVMLMDPATPGFSVVVTVTDGIPEGSMDMTEEQAKAAFSQMGSDFKMIKFEQAKLAGRDGKLMEYSLKVNNVPVQNRQIMCSVGTKGVVVTSSFAEQANTADLHKVVEAIEGSVVVK